MSFSTEVIEMVKETETQEVRKTITKLIFETKKFQDKIHQYIDANYVEFLPDLTNNEFYLNEGEQLAKDVQDLLENIENETKHQLLNANNELQMYFNELNEAALGMKISQKLVRIDDLFGRLETAKSANEQLKIMNIISDLKSLIHDGTDKILPQLDCYQSIKIKYQVESEMMLHNLKLKFENLVQFQERVFQNTKSVTLRITRDEVQLHETVIALTNSKFNPKKMCNFLIGNVFEPIITMPVSIEYDDITDDSYVQLQLSFNNSGEVNTNLRPNYKIIFKNIETVIKCLGHMNVMIADERCVFTVFGQYMKEGFFNLLIDECLTYSIPETMDEMDESTIVADILGFNQFLVDMLFIGRSEEDLALIKYSQKIDILFQNRFCANILDSSIDIMHRDLHDMIMVSDNSVAEAAQAAEESNIFPKCMVSKSVLDLISLMERIIKQSVNVKKEVANQLYSTISIILDRYISEVPTFHAKLLLNIPQQTALFHNNSMYLVFWLQKHSDLAECDEVGHSIQHQGSEYLAKQVANQKGQILEILKEFDLNVATSELGKEF